jgi:CRP-like cAMP-binding protein
MRLQMVDLATQNDCEIRKRQEDLADAVGVGRSHANVALSRLKTEGIIDDGRSTIWVLNMKRLNEAGEFNRQYLHIARD